MNQTHSSYRHVETNTKIIYDDVKTGNPNIPNETDGFEVNSEFLAFCVQGVGGRIGIWKISNVGRLPAKIPCIVNGAELNDFKFDPFDSSILFTGCEDGKLRKFKIDKGGLKEDLYTPIQDVTAHSNKVSLLLSHPTIQQMLLSASPERLESTVKIWNSSTFDCLMSFTQPDCTIAAAFDLIGNTFGCIGRDSFYVYNLVDGTLKSKLPTHKGSKASRLVSLGLGGWLSVGFGLLSQREILLYPKSQLENPKSVLLDISPSVLIPYYDFDTKVLVLVGKGERQVTFYEIDEFNVNFLTKSLINGPITSSVTWMPKIDVDVLQIEILKGYRLTQSTIEALSVTVPRIKKEYFQDDIFIPTIDFAASKVDVESWKQSKAITLIYKNLCPNGMVPLSQTQVDVVKKKVVASFEEVISKEQKIEASVKAMFETALQESTGPLKQDLMEGVAEDEWD